MSANQLLQAQKEKLEQAVSAYGDALISLGNGVEEYVINTGQTTQRVKRSNIKDIQATYDGLLNQYTVLCNRLKGGQTTIARPSW